MGSPDDLYRLAVRAGIDHDFIAKTGETVTVCDEAIRAVLGAMGIPAATDADVATSLAVIGPGRTIGLEAPAGVSCYIPDWLEPGRCFGVTCQLYSLRSNRNWGIGDFEDLGAYAEVAAATG